MTAPLGSTIGIIGGGQLGRMISLAASNLGYKTHIFTPHAERPEHRSPAALVAAYTTYAEYDDYQALRTFASSVDVVSFEFENIPEKTISFLEGLVCVRPSAKALHISQNRLREKDFLRKNGFPVGKYASVSNSSEFIEAHRELGKSVLKTIEFGYDGKGQIVVDSNTSVSGEIEKVLRQSSMILEEFIEFEKEISVIVARDQDGNCLCYQPSENKHVDGILDTSTVPASISKATAQQAIDLAKKLAQTLDIVGLLAVEFFVCKDNQLLINEIAPRPHNSGHWTMDGAVTSQFEQFVRAVCGLPLGSVERYFDVVMKNLLGNDIDSYKTILKEDNAKLHLYGKYEARKARKMGHVNYLNRGL